MSLDQVFNVEYGENGNVLNVEELIKELYVVLSNPSAEPKKKDLSNISLTTSPQITPNAQDLEYCCGLILSVRNLVQHSASNFLEYLPNIFFQEPSKLPRDAMNAYYAYCMLSSNGKYESVPRY